MTNSTKFKMQDLVYLERPEKNFFKISWKMLDWCPYNCSYCYMSKAVEAAKAKCERPSQADVECFAKNLNIYINKFVPIDDTVQLHLIGGEVAIYDLKAVLRHIDHVNKISIATNFFREQSYWLDLKQYCNSRHIAFGLSASFHLEMLNSAEKRTDFCNKLLAVKGQMKAVVDESNIELYKPYFTFVMDHNLGLEITLTRDNTNTCAKLTEDHQKYIDSIRKYMANRRHLKGLPDYFKAHLVDGSILNYSSNIAFINSIENGIADFTGFYCNAGMNNIRLTQSGTLLRSACRLCSSVMTLGNILKQETWIDPKSLEPFICNCYTAKLKSNYYNSKKVLKGCTCFNNCEMWRPGYSLSSGSFNIELEAGVTIPNYHEMYKGTDGALVNCMWDKKDLPDLDESEI